MNTTASFFHDRMHNICVALNKEKGIALFRNSVPMRTIRTMISSHPIPFKNSSPSVIITAEATLFWPVCRFVSLFHKKSEKYQPQGIWGLNRRFEKGVKKAVGFNLSFFCWGMKPPSMLQAHLW